MPSFTALAPKSSWKVPGDYHPVLGAEMLHFLIEDVVLFLGPLIAGDGSIRNAFLIGLLVFFKRIPSFEAADFCFMGHLLTKTVP